MTTEVYIDSTEVPYRDWDITIPTSPVDIAPSASVTTNANATIAANDAIEIDIDGTTVFAGYTRSGGTISELGGVEVDAYHGGRDVFEDTVSLSITAPTDQQVLENALSAAGGGTTLTVDYTGITTPLNNAYECTDRSVKRIFRDMMDRTGRIWWIDPAGTTVHVQPLGDRGTWQAIDTQADRATLQRFDTGNVDTVRNAVTVVGTGEEQVRATVEDSTSINTYGRRPGNSPYNVSYVTAESEATAVADELIVSDPQPEGTLLVGSNVGDVTQPLANYQVDVTDQGKDLDIDNLVVEKQTIEQGQATLTLGAGAGVSIAEINRKSKSKDDQNEPGSVYDSDRIADDAISSAKIRDNAVDSFKLENGAVQSINLADGSVLTTKIDQFAITETEIADDAVTTPKLVAGAVEAGKISTGTITGTEFDRVVDGEVVGSEDIINLLADKVIFADTGDTADGLTTPENGTTVIQGGKIETNGVTALQIDSDTITANEIMAGTITAELLDALQVDTQSLQIVNGSGDGVEFNESGGSVVLEPTTNGSGGIGSDFNRFGPSFFESLNMDIANIGAIGAQGSQIAEGFETGDETTADVYLRPTTDDTNYLGDSTKAYTQIHSHNFVTSSPDPIQSVDCDGLCDIDWYENPPEPVRERAREMGETDAEVPEGRDHTPVELSTMANFLLETCKAQQTRIDDLEKRIERLENDHTG